MFTLNHIARLISTTNSAFLLTSTTPRAVHVLSAHAYKLVGHWQVQVANECVLLHAYAIQLNIAIAQSHLLMFDS